MTISDREKIQKVIDRTEDLFEEKLTYISSGALVLTLTFIEKIFPIEDLLSVLFLVIGWGLLILTLVLNLLSHMISKHLLNKTRFELDRNDGSKYFKSIYLKIIKRNKTIDCINWITFILLILGISSIVTFVSINSIQKASMKNNKDIHNTTILPSKNSIFNIFLINTSYNYDK